MTRKNHIVPQFYLRQWYGKNESFYAYDFVHGKYSVESSGSIAWLLSTYPKELEDRLGDFEDKIAKKYRLIIEKLENAQWKNAILQHKNILDIDEEYALMTFAYIQSRRTISGRLMLTEEGLEKPLSAQEALDLAHLQNCKLLSELESLSKEKIFDQLTDNYRIVLRIPRQYSFWTSSNPVYYSVFDELLCPIRSLNQHFNGNDTQVLTLSPRLKLCLTYKKIHYLQQGWLPKIPRNRLSVIPLDVSVSNGNIWREDKEKIMNALNFGLLQGFEMQDKKSKKTKELDYRSSQFYLISQKQFNDSDKELFDKFHIDGIR